MDNKIQLKTILGKKVEQSQRFDGKGKRIPVTIVKAGPCIVVQIKNKDKDGYNAIQLGFENRKTTGLTKPIKGHLKKAGIEKAPRFLREIRVKDIDLSLKAGDVINISDLFTNNDQIDVTGISRGKGFTGVVKRHHFKGGPRTHGQSDRERAPGSIGQTTTPGRVYKGKRMAGRSGAEKTTVKNLQVFEVDKEKNLLIIKGLIPGVRNSLVTISKTN